MTQGYLACYEVPTISISGTGTSGTYSSRDDKWYRYNTPSSTRQVATHTFTSGSRRVRNYTTYYDGNRYAPLWVAFPMHASVYNGSYSTDSSPWTKDPAISLTQQTGLDDAQTIGISRGHFDAASYRKVNQNAHYQTYYYANQAPQWQEGFNSGVWSTMEGKILAASPSSSSDTLYVVVGVLYDYGEDDIPTKPSGNLSVPIPSHFYCCVMKCSFNSSGNIDDARGEAFIYTNEAHAGATYNKTKGTSSEEVLGKDYFVTTIDEIESKTRFDFFPKVPSDLQTAAENGTSSLSL